MRSEKNNVLHHFFFLELVLLHLLCLAVTSVMILQKVCERMKKVSLILAQKCLHPRILFPIICISHEFLKIPYMHGFQNSFLPKSTTL